ncbi:hypothetical protein CYMTET_27769 [Cymbomonas tetramitiformis]|uniref:Xylose isomerase-like TIM barrel domain-containing protein n=1 Tax=Cymbomonas tetramitiformis TaxID=36881 RepID=A0AAE0FP99_9CHLO|nr:hypothetical protein CYMTET_27769 [Cymbomonas tetramitiformis]
MRSTISTRTSGIQRVSSKVHTRAARKPLQVSANNSPAKLKLAKTLWGVPASKHNWDELFASIKTEGYDAVEAITLGWREDPVLFCELLQKHSLRVICQIHTTGGDLDSNGNYLYITSNKPADHVASLRTLVSEAKALNPLMINVHSGHDSWSVATACDYFKAALDIEADAGVSLVHETHRQRLLGFPYSAAQILQQTELQALKINADLSHWCVACEHIFDANDPRDDWWPEVLDTAAKHAALVHARVGWDQGPQVADPSAPEYQPTVSAHLEWLTVRQEHESPEAQALVATCERAPSRQFGASDSRETLAASSASSESDSDLSARGLNPTAVPFCMVSGNIANEGLARRAPESAPVTPSVIPRVSENFSSAPERLKISYYRVLLGEQFDDVLVAVLTPYSEAPTGHKASVNLVNPRRNPIGGIRGFELAQGEQSLLQFLLAFSQWTQQRELRALAFQAWSVVTLQV